MNGLLDKLNKALKPKDHSTDAAPTLRHGNEAGILESAFKLLEKSVTGKALLSYAQESGVPIHVLRGSIDNFGFFPEKSTAYISCPADIDMPNVRGVIHLIDVLRQIAQEGTEDLKAPHLRLGKDKYLEAQIERSADIRVWQSEIIYQIYKATNLTEIVDEFFHMGYRSVYEAYKADVEKEAAS